MIRSVSAAAAVVVALIPASAATAQLSVGGGVEATTDERRRGLSWSGGRAALSGDIQLDAGAVQAGARITTLRGSARHGDADMVADIDLGTGWDLGAVHARIRGTAHLFGGASGRQDYAELAGDLGYSLGPARVTAGAAWAPDQRAIGGSNLYLFVNGDVGIPGTALTVTGAIGRSSGTVDDPSFAARLRPAGGYTDWQIGVAHVQGPLTLALDYVGTDVETDRIVSASGDRRNSGDRILGRVRLSF